ncbi:hypothetical protein B0H19DRAFT_1086014 [Mycena capillaripes]|nr:hypothetical protein B0H19DRAFT_1086014 [Mycena capillaripes]
MAKQDGFIPVEPAGSQQPHSGDDSDSNYNENDNDAEGDSAEKDRDVIHPATRSATATGTACPISHQVAPGGYRKLSNSSKTKFIRVQFNGANGNDRLDVNWDFATDTKAHQVCFPIRVAGGLENNGMLLTRSSPKLPFILLEKIVLILAMDEPPIRKLRARPPSAVEPEPPGRHKASWQYPYLISCGCDATPRGAPIQGSFQVSAQGSGTPAPAHRMYVEVPNLHAVWKRKKDATDDDTSSTNTQRVTKTNGQRRSNEKLDTQPPPAHDAPPDSSTNEQRETKTDDQRRPDEELDHRWG